MEMYFISIQYRASPCKCQLLETKITLFMSISQSIWGLNVLFDENEYVPTKSRLSSKNLFSYFAAA